MVSRPWNILPVKISSHMWYNLIVPSPTKKILTKTYGGKMKHFIRLLILSAAFMTASNFMASETAAYGKPESNDGYSLSVDGFDYEGEAFTYKSTAYVSLREFACMADNSVVTWDESTHTAYVKTDSLDLSAREYSTYIEANGRVLWCENGLFTDDGILYVPLKAVAQAFGFDSHYSADEHRTYLTRERGAIEHGDEYYNADDLYWLSKIIHAESQGEPFLGKMAVGNVVLNRVDDSDFPNTVYDVIFDRKNGVQFSPVANGMINEEAGAESVAAAKICLENVSLSNDILYFLNEKLATNFWIVHNCRFVMSIGGHDFYAP